MNLSQGDVSNKLIQAQQLHRQGKLVEAEKAYLALLDQPIGRTAILASIMQLYQHTKRKEKAVECLLQLIDLEPDNVSFYDQLAQLYSELGDQLAAANCYEKLLARHPDFADGHFNHGYRLRAATKYNEALVAYGRALELGISGAEEVHLNKAVIFSDHLRQEAEAIVSLEKALDINPNYLPALFNLGNLREEAGDRSAASSLFKKALEIDSNYFEALARLADIETFSSVSDPIIQRMQHVVKAPDIQISTKANLYFALGKALNDCGVWKDAFQFYAEGNKINQQLLGDYDAKGHTKLIDSIITQFSADWFDNIEPVSDFAPIFICGMFRSGSTLIEQVLAGHPDVTAGGERDFFPRAIKSHFSPYPSSIMNVELSLLKEVAHKYEQDLVQTFGKGALITDKRPDNFLYLGLIKTLFPKARIIFTTRDARDNCLSVFFQRLGRQMLYANDLEDLAHYYQEHLRLMGHWKAIFGEDIHTVHYDTFIEDPEKVTRELLEFLGLKWHAGCLDFHKRTNHVKTASVWQVRQPLYKKSSGRWKNYEGHIAPLLQELANKNFS